MYFPYLRGKQYELLALKELAPKIGKSGAITPVIEPVKTPDGGLERCLNELWNAEVRPILIANPSVGILASDSISTEICDFVEKNGFEKFNIGLILNPTTDADHLMSEFESNFERSAKLTLIHESPVNSSDNLAAESRRLGRSHDLVSDELRRRRFSSFLAESTGVIMHDGFPVEARNADYLDRAESEFSDDLLYYIDEGWQGYGDYLTVGKGWVEGGFTPRAVAIHWTYQPDSTSPVMIRHFTSESNRDIANVGGKFIEAATKLVEFLDHHNIETEASNVMRQHVRDGTYPGLGIIKKLSMQNHIEIMANFLAAK